MRKRYNLYYLFAAEQAECTLTDRVVNDLRKKVLKIFSNYKTEGKVNASYLQKDEIKAE